MSSSHSSHHCVQVINPEEAHSDEWRYCTLCDEYFDSLAQLLQHVQLSEVHPRCNTCDRRFLNKNSRRMHYDSSSKHIYCYTCDKLFKSYKALDVHLKHSVRHSDPYSDDEDDFDDRPEGWEEELAEQFEREECAKQVEEQFTVDPDEEKSLSDVQRRQAMLRFMARRNKHTVPSESRSYRCPVCLGHPKTVASTRCGHLFCTSCISKAVEQRGECPSCRTKNTEVQIRKLDMGVY